MLPVKTDIIYLSDVFEKLSVLEQATTGKEIKSDISQGFNCCIL